VTPIYHITSAAEVVNANRNGEYTPATFEMDGLIHCSYLHQLVPVANARFSGRLDLVILGIDRARVVGDVIDENLEGGVELFPHIYARLPMSAVDFVCPFLCDADGRFELPTDLVRDSFHHSGQ
jgi:uncharacterized protein (DUF952 family)